MSSTLLTNKTPNVVVEAAGNVDTNATTQFVTDGEAVSTTIANSIPMDPSFLNSSTDTIEQTIKQFFEKPVVVASGNFTTTDTFSTFSALISPNGIINANPILQDKIKGYLGFRATTVLRLVVNATRFQQGRYNLQFMHTGGADINNTGATFRISALENTLMQRTQLPHAELDLSCDTEACLRIPYSSATNYFPMSSYVHNNGFGAVGLFRIYPYSPLVAASGSTTAGYTLWAHFEDVQLVGAAKPQSGRAFSSVKKKNESEVEQNSVNIGPISSALVRVAKFSDIVSQVPLLSSYAITTSWFANIAANAASVFGWAKPVSLAPSQRVTQNYLPWTANVDAPDMSFPLSLSCQNQVGKAVGFSGTDIDEMDFKYLATIPAWYSTTPWTVGTASGTQLLSYDVNPFVYRSVNVVTARATIHHTPCAFIASYFQKWRGSFVYKIKLVKTEFHSGRLAVSFSPFEDAVFSTTSPTFAETPYLHREIIDIRETNEFTFVVPFMSSSPYKECIDSAANGNAVTGKFTIHIVDPLVAPNTVSQSIQILLEVCMGPDVEFAVPTRSGMRPLYGLNPQSGNAFDTPVNACSNFTGSIGSSAIATDGNTNALFCIGEKISSFRTLLKMPTQIIPLTAPTAAAYLNILPYALPYVRYDTGPPAYVDPEWFPDAYATIASLYVYYRGGVRLKYLDNSPVTIADPFAVYLHTSSLDSMESDLALRGVMFDTTDGFGITDASVSRFNAPVMYYKAGYSGEVQIPAYGSFHSRAVLDGTVNVLGDEYNRQSTTTLPGIVVTRSSVPVGGGTVCSILRGMSDDANFGGFLSIPPMVNY